jgi:hypothetical protein
MIENGPDVTMIQHHLLKQREPICGGDKQPVLLCDCILWSADRRELALLTPHASLLTVLIWMIATQWTGFMIIVLSKQYMAI